MPEDLLLELETVASASDNLQNIEDLVRVMSREVTSAVERIRGSAQSFEEAWRRIVVEVAKGQTIEMHAARPRLLNALAKRLKLLKESHTLASWLRKLGRVEVSDSDVLLPDIAGLERLKTNVFDRWQTPEDLEDLAARDYPLTTAHLEQIGQQRRPPASFYAEESKPF